MGCCLQMPYLLTPEAKSRIMHGEAAMQQQQHLSAAATQARAQAQNPCLHSAYMCVLVQEAGGSPQALSGRTSAHLFQS